MTKPATLLTRDNKLPAIKAGDTVRIVRSPFNGVAVGTVAVVERVVRNHFDKGRHLYVLALPFTMWRRSELELVTP